MLTSDCLHECQTFDHLVLGYSGGMDSHVLLHLLSPLTKVQSISLTGHSCESWFTPRFRVLGKALRENLPKTAGA